MDSDIGHLVAPLVGLGLEISEIVEGAQRPEVVPDIVDGPFFDLPFFLGLGHVAGQRGNLQGPQKRQKVFVEPYQGALPLQDRGEHVVMDEFFGGALEKMERLQEAAVQGLLPLRMGELQIQQAAMTFNHGQAVEFALGVAIGHGAEMAPVDLALHARGGFEAYDGLRLFGRAAHAVQVMPHNGDPTSEALRLETLAHDCGRDLGVDRQETSDLVFERIKLTGPSMQGPWRGGIVEIFTGRLSTDAQRLGDLTYREACMRQAMDLKDSALVNHGRLPES